MSVLDRPKLKTKDMGPIMFLSLFLLLLAFFILLNALSTFEEAKARKVIKSVTSVFKTELVNKTKAQVFISLVGPIPDSTQTLKKLEKLWVTAIPLTEMEALEEGSVMQMAVPIKQIFVAGGTDIRSDRSHILEATAEILNTEFEGNFLELQFILGVESIYRVSSTDGLDEAITEAGPDGGLNPEELNLGNASESDKGLAFKRLGAFARWLEENGVSRSQISVGLQKGSLEDVQIRFTFFPIENAFNRFEAEAEDNSATDVDQSLDVANDNDREIDVNAPLLDAPESDLGGN